jgi:hypothetical protein
MSCSTPARRACAAIRSGSIDMHGMESFPSVLDVKADRVYGAVGPSKRIDDRLFVVNVGFDRVKLRIIETKQFVAAIRMP